MRCPTKTEVLAVPKSQRWQKFDDAGCKSGCSFPSLGGQAPLCLKKVKRLSREDAAKAKAAEQAGKANERNNKEADEGAAPGGAAVLTQSEVNRCHRKFQCVLPVPYSSLSQWTPERPHRSHKEEIARWEEVKQKHEQKKVTHTQKETEVHILRQI